MSDVDRNVLQQIGRTSRAVHAAFEQEVGQGLPRWRILQTLFDLRREPQGCTQKQLVRELNVDAGAMTRHLKQMEAEGLVARHSDPEDNRLTRVCLTETGTDLVRRGQGKRRAFFDKVIHDLPEAEIHAAIALMREIERRCQALYLGEAD